MAKIDMTKYQSKSRPLPVFLVLDTSGSMQGEKIATLNKALNDMVQSFQGLNNKEIEINLGIITFGAGGVSYPYELQSVSNITNIDLCANGMTPMGGALRLTKDLIENPEVLPAKSYIPSVILASDGMPNDSDWEESIRSFIHEGKSRKSDRYAIAIDGNGEKADRNVLNMFLEGTEGRLYEAKDASKIKDCFKMITMTVTQRTMSSNPNKLIGNTAQGGTNSVKAIGAIDTDSPSFFDDMQKLLDS